MTSPNAARNAAIEMKCCTAIMAILCHAIAVGRREKGPRCSPMLCVNTRDPRDGMYITSSNLIIDKLHALLPTYSLWCRALRAIRRAGSCLYAFSLRKPFFALEHGGGGPAHRHRGGAAGRRAIEVTTKLCHRLNLNVGCHVDGAKLRIVVYSTPSGRIHGSRIPAQAPITSQQDQIASISCAGIGAKVDRA